MNSYSIFWAAAFVILTLIELLLPRLETVWFVGGSLVALILSLLNVGIGFQVAAFFIVSILLIILTRPLAKKLSLKGKQDMNVNRVIGRSAIVRETIDGLTGNGCVKVDGIFWSAKCADEDDVISKGEKIEVVRVEGATLIVKREAHNDNNIIEGKV